MRGSASLVFLLFIVAAAGCADNGSGSGSGAEVAPWSGEPPISGPWLRERLPSGVLAYHRVPHPLGLLATPKGNLLDTALGSEANVRNVVEIRRGVSENIVAALGDPRLAFLGDALRSPVEVAAFGLPSPSVLVAATLDLDSRAEFEALIGRLGESEPPVSLAAPLDADGVGRLAGLPVPVFVRFDETSGQLLMSAGPNATPDTFAQVLESLPAEAAEHPMHALEARIDSSGQGWFAWVDTASVLPLAQAFMPPESVMRLRQAGLDAVRAVALGAGSANGKGRFSVLLDVGTDDARRPYPVVSNSLAIAAAGEPDAVIVASIPAPEEFARLEALMLEAMPPEDRASWEAGKQSLSDAIGVEPETVLAALGPELALIFDAAGDYAAFRLRDAAVFEDVLARVREATGATLTERSVGGRTYYHWRMPSPAGRLETADVDPEAAGLMAVLGRSANHWYWVREADYLYVAAVPQPLMDRAAQGGGTSVAEWLAETQRVDLSSALLAATGRVDKLPRRVYHAYLGVMQSLADFSDADYDVWSMPTAGELGLPERGTVGVSLNLGEPYVSLEVTYETQPGELLLGAGGLGSIAAAGVLAAVAIPAYQDYVERARGGAGGSAGAAAPR